MCVTSSKQSQADSCSAVPPAPFAQPDPATAPSTALPFVTAAFPVVGMGASAGGLAAFEAFFSGMPTNADPGMAFIVVQHLAPDRESMLVDLIRSYTRMPVFEATDGMVVQINCVYVIAPNCNVGFMHGTLHLLDPVVSRGPRLPVDFLFRSLALDQREHAIGIVLSGTGHDGTQGVRTIKGEAGMVMVQTPESSEFDSMPRSAIDTGVADYELTPAAMPACLINYVARTFGHGSRWMDDPPHKDENALRQICVLLYAQTRHAFSQYQPSIILRRIDRRMAIHQIIDIDDYVTYLRQAPLEIEALFRDMQIGVTHFFRDTEAFEALETKIIPKLFANKAQSDVVRVWVPGCSTGEEAYSITILLHECMSALKQSWTVQVFATDIDARAIATARAGLYPISVTADISEQRLARYFVLTPDGTAYRIQQNIRNLLVFSEHDLNKDPHFSKVDLISCRNLLIYLSADLQNKFIPLFYDALNPYGLLFLGRSEDVGGYVDLFSVLDRKSRLFQRRWGKSMRADIQNDGAADAPESVLPPIGPDKLTIHDEYLHAAQQSMERSNEELQSSIEEMQSINEEMETAKEELQALNEELTHSNSDLQIRVAYLTRANHDLNNFLAGLGIPTIFLDRSLRIVRFTPNAAPITNLRLTDVGRPVGHIVSNLVGYDGLATDAQAVLDTLVPVELEVQTAQERYTMRVQPFCILDKVGAGVVIAFVDKLPTKSQILDKV